MAGNRNGAAGKGRWPDMRSLRWPPAGVEPKTPAVGEGSGVIAPFELLPEGEGVAAVPPIENRTASVSAGLGPEPGPVAESVVTPNPVAEGGCQAALIVQEMRALRRAVEALTTAISGLGGTSAGVRAAPGVGVVPVRLVSDHQARHEIQEYFLRHQGETLYPAQIADALNLPVLKVAELCETLAMRGQVNRNSGS